MNSGIRQTLLPQTPLTKQCLFQELYANIYSKKASIYNDSEGAEWEQQPDITDITILY